MHQILIVPFFILSFGQVYAQNNSITENMDTTYWSKSFSAGLNLNQTSFSDNWRGGGVNSFSSGAIIEGSANYEKDRITFDNELELIYGVVRQEGQNIRKSNDRIFLDSKAGYKINEDWGSYFSLNFITQFTDGYDYENDDERTRTSSFLAPGYLTGSLGFEYRPHDDFSVRIGPLSPRFTFMRDQEISDNVPGNYGVPEGNTLRTEWLAMQIYARWNRDITDDFNIRTRYQLFANYETLDWDTIDHRLDITLIARITRLVNVTFSSINLYDIDQDSRIQYSTSLSLGILYKISN